MTTLPATGYFTNASRTNAEAKQGQDDVLAFLRQMPGGDAPTTLTLASDQVTPTKGTHAIDTEAAASTDNLAQILQTNLPDGSYLFIHSANNSRTVVVKHAAGGTGQISLSDGLDFSLTEVTMWLLLQRNGTLWEERLRYYGNAPARLTRRQDWSKGANIASAATITPGNDGNYFEITGTTTITAIASVAAGSLIALEFQGILTFTHNASTLILPGAANIITAAGDTASFVSLGSGNWRCLSYQKANGTPPVATALPRGYAAGGLVTYISGTSISIGPGSFRDDADTENLLLASTLTMSGNGAWVVGNNQPKDSSDLTLSNGMTVHWHIIKRVDTGVVDILRSASATSPVLPTNYTKSRRWKSFKFTSGAQTFQSFTHTPWNDMIRYATSTLDVNLTSPGTGSQLRTLNIPTGVVVEVFFNARGTGHAGAGFAGVVFSDPASANETPSLTAAPLSMLYSDAGVVNNSLGSFRILSNTSGQIRSTNDASDASTTLEIATWAYIDAGGRNA
jgi:hypothetical protein